MRPDSGIRTRMGPGLWDGSSLTPEAGIALMRTDMPVPDGMKRMGSGTIWGSQMDACLRTAHPIWKTAGTRLTAREKAPMPVRITAAGSGTAFTGSTGDPAGLM